jgi:hypothetical protein
MTLLIIILLIILLLQYILLQKPSEKLFEKQSNTNKGKIAFLFLTIDNINSYDVWMKYLKGNEDRYSIYVHPKYPEKVTQELIKKNIIKENTETGWGTIGSVRANLLLLKNALNDTDNKMFILVSDSCIPVQSFDKFYNFIFNDMKTNIPYFIQHMERYDQITNPMISRDQFRKHCAQGLVFNRKHAILLNDNDTTEDWKDVNFVDENYFYNNIIQHDMNDINKYKITFDLWSLIGNNGHDNDSMFKYFEYDVNNKLKMKTFSTFSTLNDEFLDKIKENGYYFMRKVDKECKFDNLTNFLI